MAAVPERGGAGTSLLHSLGEAFGAVLLRDIDRESAEE